MTDPSKPFDIVGDLEVQIEALRQQLAEALADSRRLDWLESQGHDYGSDAACSSITACRQWSLIKKGHGGQIRQAIDQASAGEKP